MQATCVTLDKYCCGGIFAKGSPVHRGLIDATLFDWPCFGKAITYSKGEAEDKYSKPGFFFLLLVGFRWKPLKTSGGKSFQVKPSKTFPGILEGKTPTAKIIMS